MSPALPVTCADIRAATARAGVLPRGGRPEPGARVLGHTAHNGLERGAADQGPVRLPGVGAERG
ncbi:hypothetical protein ACQPYE_23165 [Actinosynnema sp. CA-299493]